MGESMVHARGYSARCANTGAGSITARETEAAFGESAAGSAAHSVQTPRDRLAPPKTAAPAARASASRHAAVGTSPARSTTSWAARHEPFPFAAFDAEKLAYHVGGARGVITGATQEMAPVYRDRRQAVGSLDDGSQARQSRDGPNETSSPTRCAGRGRQRRRRARARRPPRRLGGSCRERRAHCPCRCAVARRRCRAGMACPGLCVACTADAAHDRVRLRRATMRTPRSRYARSAGLATRGRAGRRSAH